jgi:NOL1/NOP2/sun family putative RNA methylase
LKIQLPEELLESLKDVKGFDKKAFEKVHASGEQITSVRINPFKVLDSKVLPPIGGVDLGGAIPWTDYGYYLSERPSFTFDPLFHAGCYYVQEASSMFLEQALKQTVDLSKPLRILDLCASPGGKSTHVQSLITKDSLLVSNDAIKLRSQVLKDNIIKWGCENVVVTNNDPKDFSLVHNFFDVMIVDAPCSGSGLFRKDEEAMEEWSLDNVTHCSRRQQRIIADALPCLKKDGILIYSTCSYSVKENEDICAWITEQWEMESLQLKTEKSWGIVETKAATGEYGYRFYPDKVKGEGFFIACFKKEFGRDEPFTKGKMKPEYITKDDEIYVRKMMLKDNHKFFKYRFKIYSLPGCFDRDLEFLMSRLWIQYFGTMLGELKHQKLIPEHAFALNSKLVKEEVERVELDEKQAIDYLKRKEILLETGKGWKIVTYQQQPIGWINALGNRVNNYYPKEMRIIKDR